jgi:hypothetical protein
MIAPTFERRCDPSDAKEGKGAVVCIARSGLHALGTVRETSMSSHTTAPCGEQGWACDPKDVGLVVHD